jgi:hypothetical protein
MTETKTTWLPFSHWNLRYNPFGELTPSERASVAVVDVEPIAQRLAEGQTAIQFIGKCGRGKTTRLLAIQRHLVVPGSATIYLPPMSWAIPRWWHKTLQIAGTPIIIDEAQRMPPPIRFAIFRRREPLVLGTHRDLTGPLRRAGYRVFTYHVGAQNDPYHVAKVANARLCAARLTAAEVPQLSIQDAQWLVTRFGDDLRAIESFLYNQVQQQVGCNGQMRFID